MAFGWIMIAAMVLSDAMPAQNPQATSDRPNILWLTCEDISPNLGCYGDSYAVTPNLDAMAEWSVRYTHAFAPIGVCAPSRSTLITGMWANSIGTHHMRCQGRLPSIVTGFPKYLRDAGYYTNNNVKTDYNFKHKADVWMTRATKLIGGIASPASHSFLSSTIPCAMKARFANLKTAIKNGLRPSSRIRFMTRRKHRFRRIILTHPRCEKTGLAMPT